MKDILCIIPARKGSKGVKLKNFIKLNNKEIIQYTIDTAKRLDTAKNLAQRMQFP